MVMTVEMECGCEAEEGRGRPPAKRVSSLRDTSLLEQHV